MKHGHFARCSAAALLVSALAAAPAMATPGNGFTVSPVVNGSFGTLHINTPATDEKWEMHLKTRDSTDVGADRLTVVPQGHSGWHAHPAPVFVTVTQGTIEWMDSLLCTPRTLTVGQSVLETAFRAHNVRNPAPIGGTTAEFIAIRLKPTSVIGPAFRIDVSPAPNNCSF